MRKGKSAIGPRSLTLFPWLVLAVSLAFTATATLVVSNSIERHEQRRFENDVDRASQAIENRVKSYSALLQGAKGMFTQNNEPKRADFQNYVNGLRLGSNFPGMAGIGYVANLTDIDQATLQQRLDRDNITGFKPWPSSQSVPFDVLYLEEEGSENKHAQGFNMASDPQRLVAMNEAVRLRKTLLVGPVKLTEEPRHEHEDGLLILVPVFFGAEPEDGEDASTRIIGFVYSPIFPEAMFSQLAPNEETVKVYLGKPSKDTLLYDSGSSMILPHPDKSTFTKTVNGSDEVGLTLEFRSTPSFDARSERALIPFTAMAGVLFSGLLFFFTFLESIARKKAQQEAFDRQFAQRELGMSERRLRNLIEQAPVSIQVVSPDGHCIEVNGGFEKLWQASLKNFKDVNLLEHPYMKECGLLPYVLRALSGKPTTFPATEVDIARLAGEGRTRWIMGSAYPLKDQQGRVREVVVMHQDLTDAKKAEEEIVEMNAYLEQRVEERTEELRRAVDEMEAFSYSVAHDLRAPLRAMGSFARILMEDHSEGLDEEAQGFLNRIGENSVRMGELIDGLLDLARISRATLDIDEVDLSKVVEELWRNMEKRYPAPLPTIRIQPALRADADIRLIRAALQNLLDNAWKFSRRESQPVIHFGAENRGGETVYFIRDNGAGFDPSYINKLFRPFERLHTGTEYPGTGIGLATVRRIIERHGGKVWAEGELDKGATFYFTLPSTKTVNVMDEHTFYLSEGVIPKSRRLLG